VNIVDEKCIASVVCSKLEIEPDRWDEFREVVREQIRVKRNTCNCAVKKQYMRKYCVHLFIKIVCCSLTFCCFGFKSVFLGMD